MSFIETLDPLSMQGVVTRHACKATDMDTSYYIIIILIIAHAHCTKHDSQYTSTTCLVSSSLIGEECRKNVSSNVLVHNVSLFPRLQNEIKQHYNWINSRAEMNCMTIAISPAL